MWLLLSWYFSLSPNLLSNLFPSHGKRKVPPGADRAKECNFHSTPCLTAKADLGPSTWEEGDGEGPPGPLFLLRPPRAGGTAHRNASPPRGTHTVAGGSPDPSPARQVKRRQGRAPESGEILLLPTAPAAHPCGGSSPAPATPERPSEPPHVAGCGGSSPAPSRLCGSARPPPPEDSPRAPALRPTAGSRTPRSLPGGQHPARRRGVPGCSSGPEPPSAPAEPPRPRNPGPPGAPPARARTHRAGGPCYRGARPQGPGGGCRLSPAASAAAPTPGPRRVPMSVPAAAGAPWPIAAPRRAAARLPQAVAGGGVGCISPGYIAAPGCGEGSGMRNRPGCQRHTSGRAGERGRGAGSAAQGWDQPGHRHPDIPHAGIPASRTAGLRTR